MANLLAGALPAFSFAMLEVSGSLILAERQQDYPITKAITNSIKLLGDVLDCQCAGLGTTNSGNQAHPGQKAGSDLPRLRPFARARYRLQDQ
jgi:hypothetical protein